MPLVTEIADAVVADLNAAGLDPPVTAVRRLVPQWTMQELETLRVTAVPRGVTEEPLDRAATSLLCQVDVAVQQRVDVDDADEVDPLMDLVEDIAARLRGRALVLPDGSRAVWRSLEWSTLYAPEHMVEHRLFTAVLTVGYEVTR